MSEEIDRTLAEQAVREYAMITNEWYNKWHTKLRIESISSVHATTLDGEERDYNAFTNISDKDRLDSHIQSIIHASEGLT